MIKYFVIYALMAALIIAPWFTIVSYKELNGDISRIVKETGATEKQILITLYILLILLAWAWLPYKVIKSIVNKVKGN